MPAANISQKGIGALLAKKSVLMLNVAALTFMAWGFSGEYGRSRGLEKEVARLQVKAEELQAKNLEIAEIGRRFSDSEGIEREARLKLGMQKPGESVVIVRTGQEPKAGGGGSGVSSAEKSESYIIKWWRYFFN